MRIGFEFTPDGAQRVEGHVRLGRLHASPTTTSTPKNPKSPLAKKFVEDFNKEYGEDPDFYAANFYENAFVMWEVMRRV